MEHIGALISPACALLTIALTLFNIWGTVHNRAEADWIFLERKPNLGHSPIDTVPGLKDWLSLGNDQELEAVLSVINTGDGAGYDVSATGIGCIPLLVTTDEKLTGSNLAIPDSLARILPAESFFILVFTQTEKQKNDVIIDLHWTRQPTRLHKRVHTLFRFHGNNREFPVHPIPEKTERHPTLLRYRLEHLQPAMWIYKRFSRLWNLRFSPFFRTLK